MALETPRSPRGLHLLARHGPAFASSLFLFISGLNHLPAGSATASSAPPAVAAGLNLSQQSTGHLDTQTLHQRLAVMRHHQRAYFCPDKSVTSSDAALLVGAPQQAQQPWHGARCGQPAAEVAAAVATAHRCLESMLARDSIFALSPSQIAQALFSPALVFGTASGRPSSGQTSSRPIAMLSDSQWETNLDSGHSDVRGPSASDGGQGGRLGWALREGAGIYIGCCSLIMAGLRHRARAVKRCMALVGASTRALLKALMLWSQPNSPR